MSKKCDEVRKSSCRNIPKRMPVCQSGYFRSNFHYLMWSIKSINVFSSKMQSNRCNSHHTTTAFAIIYRFLNRPLFPRSKNRQARVSWSSSGVKFWYIIKP